mgnify:CR=1 FL=1
MRYVFDLPPGLFIVLAALAGLAVGNWLTLLTHRLPRMMEQEWQAHCQEAAGQARTESRYGLWSPASHCPACAAPVTGWRRAPLLGWLLLRGRCAACGTAIGWRYPAIELLTCALFAACAWRFGATPLALCAMGLSATLVALAWIDFESTLLPDALTQPLLWAGLLVNLTDAFATLRMAVAGAVAGPPCDTGAGSAASAERWASMASTVASARSSSAMWRRRRTSRRPTCPSSGAPRSRPASRPPATRKPRPPSNVSGRR